MRVKRQIVNYKIIWQQCGQVHRYAETVYAGEITIFKNRSRKKVIQILQKAIPGGFVEDNSSEEWYSAKLITLEEVKINIWKFCIKRDFID